MTHRTDTQLDLASFAPALAHLRAQQARLRAIQEPPALRAVRELRDRLVPSLVRAHRDMRRALEPALPNLRAMGGAVLALQETTQRLATAGMPAVLRALPHLRRAARMAEALAREEDTAWDAWWAVATNRLTWLRAFTVNTLGLTSDHVGAVIEALQEGGWQDADDPIGHLTEDARRRHANDLRTRAHRLLPIRNQGWLDVETELLSSIRRGVDTDPGPAFGRLVAQIDLRSVLRERLPDGEAAIAILVVQGYSEAEIMEELDLTQRQLWAARKRLARRGVRLASRRSPRSTSS